jgi:hypothetical protein
MTAKQAAVRDIKKSLRSESKCFLNFIPELDSIMETLVNQQIEAQEKIQSSWCPSLFTSKKAIV